MFEVICVNVVVFFPPFVADLWLYNIVRCLQLLYSNKVFLNWIELYSLSLHFWWPVSLRVFTFLNVKSNRPDSLLDLTVYQTCHSTSSPDTIQVNQPDKLQNLTVCHICQSTSRSDSTQVYMASSLSKLTVCKACQSTSCPYSKKVSQSIRPVSIHDLTKSS